MQPTLPEANRPGTGSTLDGRPLQALTFRSTAVDHQGPSPRTSLSGTAEGAPAPNVGATGPNISDQQNAAEALLELSNGGPVRDLLSFIGRELEALPLLSIRELDLPPPENLFEDISDSELEAKGEDII